MRKISRTTVADRLVKYIRFEEGWDLETLNTFSLFPLFSKRFEGEISHDTPSRIYRVVVFLVRKRVWSNLRKIHESTYE